MADLPYRVLITYEPSRQVYVARAPELPNCSAEGLSHGEAFGRLEQEIAAQIANIRESGSQPPKPLDSLPAQNSGDDASRNLNWRPSTELAREIIWQARLEQISPELLLTELVARGLGARRLFAGDPAQKAEGAGEHNRNGQRPPHPQSRAQSNHSNAPRGGFNERQPQGGHRSSFGRQPNPALLEDSATFMEYVRSLEKPNDQGHRASGNSPSGGGGNRRDGGNGRNSRTFRHTNSRHQTGARPSQSATPHRESQQVSSPQTQTGSTGRDPNGDTES